MDEESFDYIDTDFELVFDVYLRSNVLNEVLVAVRLSDILNLSIAFAQGDPNWSYEGKAHSLDDSNAMGGNLSIQIISIYTGKKPIAQFQNHFRSKFRNKNLRPELLWAKLKLEPEQDVTNEFLRGIHGEGKLGRIAELYLNKILGAEMNQNDQPWKKAKPIFISHSSKDKEVTDAFVMGFLRNGLGIQVDKEVYYTSHPATGISGGKNFRNDIRTSITNATIVFCFISENFRKSQYCIAEIGAAWAHEIEIIPLTISNEESIKSGELLGPLQYDLANDRGRLNRLRDDLADAGIGKRIESTPMYDEELTKYIKVVDTYLETQEGSKKT